MKIINIGYYNRVKYFDLFEANALLPIIMKITRLSAQQIALHDEILSHTDLQPQFLAKITADKQALVEKWCNRIEQLGCLSLRESGQQRGSEAGQDVATKIFGTALFDTGHGYLYWSFPQHQLRYFVHYEDDVAARLNIEEVTYQYPQWLSPYDRQSSNDACATLAPENNSKYKSPLLGASSHAN